MLLEMTVFVGVYFHIFTFVFIFVLFVLYPLLHLSCHPSLAPSSFTLYESGFSLNLELCVSLWFVIFNCLGWSWNLILSIFIAIIQSGLGISQTFRQRTGVNGPALQIAEMIICCYRF